MWEVCWQGRSLFLTLHEPSAQEVELVLSDRDRLCTCDVALFVYDSSSEASLDTAARQLKQLVGNLSEGPLGMPARGAVS